jgi:ABC-type glycerol-3-phosphate transport system substrate-binding protein
MKKAIVLVLCIALLSGLAAGCKMETPTDTASAPVGSSAAPESSAPVTDEEITITYQTISASDMFTKAFAEYQKDHPNLKLDVQASDAQEYNAKVIAQCETKTLPDVTWWNGAQFAGAWDTGAFLD